MMKKENFDEEFKNQIKQVFEEYHDGAANKSWNLLREKYPEKKRRDVIFWWISAAAIILIAFIFWLFQPNFYQKNACKIVKQQPIDTVSALPNGHSSIQKPASNKVATNTINTKKIPIKTASGFAAKRSPETNKLVQNQTSTSITNIQKTSVKTASNFVSIQAAIKNNQTVLTTSQQKLQSKTEVDNQKNTLFTGIKKVSDTTFDQAKIPSVILKDSSGQKTLTAVTKKTISILAKPAATKKDDKVKTAIQKSSKFSFGLYAGSHVNYASGSNNQLGLGAGFSTDFRLSKNFKLFASLGLMQNNLTYSQDIPNGSLNAANANYNVSSTSVVIQTPSLSSLDARLLALDIPLNLTYNFLIRKNSISVSAGISSNTFVKETYDYHYSNSTNTTQNIKSFNNFNFAKTLNLAAGFAYPLGKKQLQIEPFLKYPLGGSGSQQLQFGSAGINLKMNIQSFKK